MRPLGSIEAFEPALHRTRAVLARPFRLGRSWKLAFCAYLALAGSHFLPLPLWVPFLPHITLTPLLLLFSALSTALLFAFYYLGSRMQFVLFDMVLTLDGRIAPLWRLRPASLIWRWIAIKLAITLPLALLLSLPLIPLLRRLFLLFQSIAANHRGTFPGHQPFDPHLFVAILSLYAVLLAAMAVLFFLGSLLSDFVLPVLAFENTGIAATLRRSLDLLQSDPAAILGFLGFQVLLALAGLIAQYTAATIASLLAAIPLALIAFVGYFALHAIAPPALLAIAGVLLYMVFIGLSMYLQLATFGTLMVFLRSYSLLFLAGRYPPLSPLLYTAPPPPPTLL